MRGSEYFSGHSFRYWYKNENHATWLDNKLYVTSPDIVCVINSKSGEPLPNPQSKVGDAVSIIGFPSKKNFRTAKALQVLGPRHFGIKADFRPIEKILG